MRHVRLVSLRITDADAYARYRDGMEPLLAAVGGRFLVDVEPARSVASPGDFTPTRVLAIGFPDRATAEGFFGDPAYVAVRRRWFETAVEAWSAVAVG